MSAVNKPARYGIKRVTKFETPDGQLHETFAAAQVHVSETTLDRWLHIWLSENCEGDELRSSADDLARDLRKDWIMTRKQEEHDE